MKIKKNIAAAVCAVVTLAASLCFAQEWGPPALPLHIYSRVISPSPVSQSLAGAGTAMASLDGFGGLVNPALTSAAPRSAGIFAGGVGRHDQLFDRLILPFAAVFADRGGSGMMGVYYRYMDGTDATAHEAVLNLAGTLFDQAGAQGAVEFGLNLRYEGSNRKYHNVVYQGMYGPDFDTYTVHGKSFLADIGFYQPDVYPGLDFSIVINNVTGYVKSDVNGANTREGWLSSSMAVPITGMMYMLPLWGGVALRLPIDLEMPGLFTSSFPTKYVLRAGADVRISHTFSFRFGYSNAPEDPLELISDFDYDNLFFGGFGVTMQAVQVDFFAGKDEFGVTATYRK